MQPTDKAARIAGAVYGSMAFTAPFSLLGEVSLTLWLLAVGLNAERWKEQASRMTNDELSGARFQASRAGVCWLMTMAAH
jgi:hypothetical protein